MTTPLIDRQFLAQVNATAVFNTWAGFQVAHAEPGLVELRLPWRAELGQYEQLLHAGITAALVDTACGFAAATVSGRVLASHYAVAFLAPARGDVFVARASVVKAGRRQVFARAEVHAEADGVTTLVATGETILVPTGPEK